MIIDSLYNYRQFFSSVCLLLMFPPDKFYIYPLLIVSIKSCIWQGPRVPFKQLKSTQHHLIIPPHPVVSSINILYQCGTFVKIDQPMLIPQNSLFVLYSSMGFDKCVTFIHHYSILQNSFTILKMPFAPPIHLLTPPFWSPWKPLIFLLSIVLPFPECHRVGIIQPFQPDFFHLAPCI